MKSEGSDVVVRMKSSAVSKSYAEASGCPVDAAQFLELVRAIATPIWRRLPTHVELDDLLSAGNLGLSRAMLRFDAKVGKPLEHYASVCIRGAIMDHLRDVDLIPHQRRREWRKVQDAIELFEGKHGHAPDDAQVAGILGITLDRVAHIRADAPPIEFSNGYDQSAEDFESEKADVMGNQPDKRPDPLGVLLSNENTERIAQAVSQLSEREQLVLSLLFIEEISANEIGTILRVSSDTVWSVRRTALRHLRQILQR